MFDHVQIDGRERKKKGKWRFSSPEKKAQGKVVRYNKSQSSTSYGS